MFGFTDPRLGPMNGQPAWQNPGPVAPVPLTPGFRPPGAAMGGMQGATPQAAPMGMGMPGMMPFGMMKAPGPNEQQVNKTNDAAGTSDPMAQGAAQAADMSGGNSFMSWLKGLF